MSKYGLPYKGSKAKIAKEILEILPSGKRLVDLFGGGFAITHCAMVEFPNKWDSFLYNDINPLLPPLIQDAINGKYNYDFFKPEFVTREKFFAEKETDGYIKWIWSFGNSGRDYLFGKDKEHLKHLAHDFVVFGRFSDELDNICHGIEKAVNATDISERRLQFCRYAKQNKNRFDLQRLERLQQLEWLEQLQRLQQLEQLQRLERLQQLERLERLERLELTSKDYEQYTYRDGDIVYCDIPYEDDCNGKTYTGELFDFNRFYDWAFEQPFPIYYSSYNGRCGELIWEKEVRTVFNSASGAAMRTERLYKL